MTYNVREAMRRLNIDSTKAVAAIQGFGNVAQYAAKGFIEPFGWQGHVCVSYWDRADRTAYTVSKADGIDPDFLMSITDQYGGINKDEATKAGYQIEAGDAWISKEADVLIPAALEGQVNAETVQKVHDRVKTCGRGRQWPHHTGSG